MEEIWKAVNNYEGLYEVSNFGNVRSLPRKATAGRILKTTTTLDGYLQVSLSKNSSNKKCRIHRLVAEAFIDKQDEQNVIVDHINHNIKDNCVSNLRWVSHTQSSMNRGVRSNNKSGYTGVFWSQRHQSWRVTITYNKIHLQGGYFKKLEDAIEKRKELEVQYFKEYAYSEN